jgi:pimeloyl-ACP methyl ester carboxylesterase
MFRYQDRGYLETLILVRGWAFDDRVFQSLALPFNYLFYQGPHVPHFKRDLHAWLDRAPVCRVHLLGWSMGAYAVNDFALAHPERVGQALLVGARQQYPPDEVEVVRTALHRNRRGFMRKFYKDCYAGHDPGLHREFKQTLLPDYLDRWTVAELEEDLDWICSRSLDVVPLDRVVELSIVHGSTDRIVPWDEAQALAAGITRGRFVVVPEAGHLPFLARDFQARLYAGV